MILPEHSCHSDVGDVPICMKYFLVLPLTTFPPTTNIVVSGKTEKYEKLIRNLQEN